ncbi:peptide chain release factor 2 [candidate division TA06 bacterium DG_26]|uniref:Peptide chain release factor 2 n=1 Tax=candidate division TA06 bacterium DG_26 TaxID=1703771 RepID=A0A0S7WGA8_UNCT6|nr:MAG: peptide chain release factor 2 [candidate division TA06 bacterium DG_26]
MRDWSNYEVIFDIDGKKRELQSLELESLSKGFWGNSQRAKEVTSRLAHLREVISKYELTEKEVEDLSTLAQLDESEEILRREAQRLERTIEELETASVLDQDEDQRSAILSIHPGAGGLESQDWAEMLLRMYLRWIERMGYQAKTLDLQPGEGAGVKDVTVEVRGEYAYGYLKSESGVHRLVRLSPFDAAHRRHTSFASIFVYPLVEDDLQVELKEKDLKIETFRASGPGGQHVNVSDTAVRITHLPTGIRVSCQSERSQYQNKQNALKVLRARLYRHYKEAEEKKLQRYTQKKTEISWGNQIRSYVLHPYKLIKDHRTDLEERDVDKVLDGEIDEFIRAYLLLKEED